LQKSTLVKLGNTSLAVSRLSFGTAFMGSWGDNLLPQAGADLLDYAYQQGITFWDTSEDYGTHAHLACALKCIPRNQVVISSKLNIPTHSIDGMLQEMGIDYVDILFIHDVGLDDLKTAKETIQSWQSEKSKGRLRAIGLSTHSALVAESVCEWADLEVLMLPINATGACLPGMTVKGGMERMKVAAEEASNTGKGIIAMKVMGCGALADQPRQAIEHVAKLPYVHNLCIGMRNRAEIDQNIQILHSLEIARKTPDADSSR
jgi:aryl-alcohol dehydrogenase-like predicted oxidoreductase